jgi:hypothetical protein
MKAPVLAESCGRLGLCAVVVCSGSAAKGGGDSGHTEDAQQPNDGGIINDAAGSVCPATYAAASVPATCIDDSAECNYDEGSCVCNGGTLPTNHLSWECTPLNPGCPYEAPAANSACTRNGLLCEYGPCGKTSFVCMGGIWSVEGSAGCPN